jgi:hypothetical protein
MLHCCKSHKIKKIRERFYYITNPMKVDKKPSFYTFFCRYKGDHHRNKRGVVELFQVQKWGNSLDAGIRTYARYL